MQDQMGVALIKTIVTAGGFIVTIIIIYYHYHRRVEHTLNCLTSSGLVLLFILVHAQ